MSINDDIQTRQECLNFSYPFKYSIVLGCGGIGSWVGLNLALSCKVDNIILIDHDIIEESNLNRTPFRICDIGNYKVDALKYLILERRAVEVKNYVIKTNNEFSNNLYYQILKENNIDETDEIKIKEFYLQNMVIVDCRDDIYKDFYNFPCKYYKLGYDGCSITIDGDPKNTPVWGRANGYTVTPSFICPAQLIANITVNDIILDQSKNLECNDYYCDEDGKLNTCFTTDSQYIMKNLFLMEKFKKG